MIKSTNAGSAVSALHKMTQYKFDLHGTTAKKRSNHTHAGRAVMSLGMERALPTAAIVQSWCIASRPTCC